MKKKEDRRGQRMIIISRSPFPRKLERDDKDARDASSLKKFRRTTNEGFYLARQIPTFRVLLAHLLRILILLAVLRVCVCVYIYREFLSDDAFLRRIDLFLIAAKVSVPFKTTRALRFAFFTKTLSPVYSSTTTICKARRSRCVALRKKRKRKSEKKKKTIFDTLN